MLNTTLLITLALAVSLPAGAASLVMPPEAARVFERACKDCHSNNTEWPWYARIPPISLGISADVQKGRAAWNISEWDNYSKGRKLGFLSAIAMDVLKDNMPPRTYRWMHSESALNKQDRAVLADWAIAERKQLRLAATKQVASK